MLLPEKLLKHLHSIFEAKEAARTKYYFTITALFDQGENNRLVLATKETGLANYDKYMEAAQELEPDKIEVRVYQKKTDTDRMSERTLISFSRQEQDDSATMLERKLQEGIESIKESFSAEGLKGVDTSALGVIEQRFAHQTDKLRWENEKSLLLRDHTKKTDDLTRELNEKEQELLEERAYTGELEDENKKLAEELTDLRENRYTLNGIDLSKELGKAGLGLAEKIAKKYSGALSGLMGLPPEAIDNVLASGANPSGDQDQRLAQLIEVLKQIHSQCDDQREEQLINLLVIILQNMDTLDVITQFLTPKKS